MGRYYRLSKKITDDMATAILNEINELENVQTARITEDISICSWTRRISSIQRL